VPRVSPSPLWGGAFLPINMTEEQQMTQHELAAALAQFETDLAAARDADAAFAALQRLTQHTVGAKLFTVMTVDMKAGLARRAYSSDPEAYPVSGTKPIHYDEWFETVREKRIPFVANTLADIAEVFPDHELIGTLGCGSVINLPVFVEDVLLGTVNMLHEEQYYTPARIVAAKDVLAGPAIAAYKVALGL
jgi:hypothetical protein